MIVTSTASAHPGLPQVLGAQMTGSKRKELTLTASSRQQRDLLLMSLCAFTTPGWLDAALVGRPPPVARLMAGAAKPAETPEAVNEAGLPWEGSTARREAVSPAAEGRLKAKTAFSLGGLFRSSRASTETRASMDGDSASRRDTVDLGTWGGV